MKGDCVLIFSRVFVSNFLVQVPEYSRDVFV